MIENYDEELKNKCDQAERTGERIPVGDIVVCDFCNEDFTDYAWEGGMIFESKAVCPPCTDRMMPDIIKFHEQRHIKAMCPDGTTFADFVRKYRGPDAAIRIISYGKTD